MYPVPELFQSRQLVDMPYSASQRPHIERFYLPAAPSRMQTTQQLTADDEVSDVPLPRNSRASASADSKYGSSYSSTLFVPVAPSRERSVVSSSTENVAQQGLQALGLDLYQPTTPRGTSFRFPSAGMIPVYVCVCACVTYTCMHMQHLSLLS
jgi:hypothetical protein